MRSEIPYKQHTTILIRTSKGLRFIASEDIIYCKADGRYSSVHLNSNESILVSKLLKELEETLPNHLFYRIHKSCIVNIKYLKEYNPDDEIVQLNSTDVELKIAIRRKAEFLKFLSKSFLYI